MEWLTESVCQPYWKNLLGVALLLFYFCLSWMRGRELKRLRQASGLASLPRS